jgi:hypothetical protein
MPERFLKCTQCGAALTPPSRFARQVVCAFCGAAVTLDPSVVSAARFREALLRWEGDGWSLGGGRWKIGHPIARGEVSDVYLAERARWPSELAVLKLLRDSHQVARFDREWTTLRALEQSAELAERIPQPIMRGVFADGPHAGAHGMLLRRATGFRRTFEDVRRAYPTGMDPRVSIWMWRRVLETLALLHRGGYAHGAVTAAHLLVEDGEHGVLLVGFGHASQGLDPAEDTRASARVIESMLGGHAPAPLASFLAGADGDAWALQEQVGALGRTLFGAPGFHPV